MASLVVDPMPTVVVEPPKAQLKTMPEEEEYGGAEFVEFETEVLYARIEELENRISVYKNQQQTIKQIVKTHFDNPKIIRDKLVNVLSIPCDKKKAITDSDIKKAIEKIIIVD